MSDTFLSASALVAAGGNSRAARAARAKLQLRDRKGRWIEMGRGVKFNFRGLDGANHSAIGTFVGARDANNGQVYVSNDPNGLRDGFYTINSNNADMVKATLDEEDLPAGADASPVSQKDIPDINALERSDAPDGWKALAEKFQGKNAIETEDGDFAIYYGGPDAKAFVGDKRGNPGSAEGVRSIAEAFKKVSEVDIAREDGGDSEYVGLGSEEDNAAALASQDRDSKIDQIKLNERTILNDRANIDAKQRAASTNQQIMQELEAAGQPYDPEGNDSDEALAARKAAPATPESVQGPLASTGDIDTTMFDVAPEGFLVPTGKSTNDITPEGLASFMTAEKESLGKGGARLVVDTDAGTAEIHNSADTLENAQAQAGGLGQSRVLDLANGKVVETGDVVDPNSPEVNPNLEGDTSANAPTGGAPDVQSSDPNAVEPQPASPGADAPASPESNGEAQRAAEPTADAPAGSDAIPAAPAAGADGNGAEGGSDGTDSAEPAASEDGSGAAPGSVEDLKSRRSQVQAALDNAGDPKDIIALNEQADELDTRIAAKANEAPEADASETPDAEADAPAAPAADNEARLTELADEIRTLEEQNDRLQKDLESGASGRPDEEISAEIDKVFEQVADLQTQFDELERGGPANETDEPAMTLADQLDSAWAATDPFPDSNLERRERSALRILRDAEKNGDLQKGINRLSQEEKDALSDDIADAVGIERAKPEPEPTPEPDTTPADAPETPEDTPAATPEPENPPAPAEAAPARPAYEEPGNADAVSDARKQLDEIDAEIENELTLAENSTDPMEQSEHLSRVRTLERQRKIQENALNRALGNAPMDFNGDLGWSMRNPDNRGSLPDAPEAPSPEPDAAPEADTPAVLDETIDAPPAEVEPVVNAPKDLDQIGPSSLRVGDYIEHPETGNIVRITNIESERFPEEGATKFTISYESKNSAEDDKNQAAGNVELWSTDKIDTYKGWGDDEVTPEEAAKMRQDDIIDALRSKLAGETLEPWQEDLLAEFEQERSDLGLEGRLTEARDNLRRRQEERLRVLLQDEYSDEEIDRATELRDWAQDDVDAVEEEIQLRDSYLRAEQEETQDAVEPGTQRLLDVLDEYPATAESERRAEQARQEFLDDQAADNFPADESGQIAPELPADLRDEYYNDILNEIAERDDVESQVGTDSGIDGLYDGDDDPYNPDAGQDNRVATLKAKMQGKELTADERDALQAALASGVLSNSQVQRIAEEIEKKPNRANTITITRPDTEIPEYNSTADLDIVNAERDDPNFVFDEDLVWQRLLEENPDATVLPNGDVIYDTATNKNKRYDAMIRRTAKNRYLVYVMETDQQGNRRAKRLGNTEWHSYEALENRMKNGRDLIHAPSPAGSIARRKDQPTEFLGTQGFPQDDFLGDIGNPDADIPTTGDAKFDKLLEVAAAHIRNETADIHGIEADLQKIDPGAKAVNTIMDAIIGRAQDAYRPNGVNPWQLYNGETAEVGMTVDWTDWHQELDWWLPNGQLNPNRKPNPRYAEVRRAIIKGYVKENSDGKGHTYGDHVWVQFVDAQGRPVGNWVKRSAQTLRMVEDGSDPSAPFFSKREEWRTNPEALARRFRVPNVEAEEPVQTKPRPKGDLPNGRRLRFTSRGNLAGYSNVRVPSSQAEIAGLILSGEVLPQIRPASEARPGMMIVRRDDNGTQFADTIIRVENLGDGGYRIHAARPDGRGNANVDAFVVPGDADIPLWTAPNLTPNRAPSEPTNARQGELVQFNRDGIPVEGVVVFDDGNGNMIVSTPSGDTLDVHAGQVSAVSDPEVSAEERQDLFEALDSHQIPEYIKDLIRRGIFSPGLSADRYRQLVEIMESFDSKTPQIEQVDQVLDIINATEQQRSDVHDYFATEV